MDEAASVTAPPGRVGQSERCARMADLLDAAKGGSEDALGQITAELSPMLWHVARAAGLAADDAEDVVQTAWERLLSHLADIRVPQALVSWLVVTTKHEAWRIRSSGRRQRPADQEWLMAIPDEAAGPRSGSSSTSSSGRCGGRSGGSRRSARSCCGSSPSYRARTTSRCRPRSACRWGASAPPGAGAWRRPARSWPMSSTGQAREVTR